MFKGFMTVLTLSAAFLGFTPAMAADENVLHIYSSRHYDTDEQFYENFTNATGIEVKRVDGKGDELITRLQQEGEQSPAALFITVDAGRLWRAEQADLFEPIHSDVLDTAIPERNSYYLLAAQTEGQSLRARLFEEWLKDAFK